MPYCNNCGHNISSKERVYRRQIYSGTTHRTNYGKRLSFGTYRRYAIRNVCESCARQIDEQNEKSKKTILIVVMIIAIVIAIFFLIK